MRTYEGAGSTTGRTRRSGRFDRRVLVGLVVAVAAAFLAQAALAAPAPPNVPDGLTPAGNKPFLLGHGVGVQIYSCNGTSWNFVAPRANLFADNGQLIISHFGGP